jgi:hypothetical protein
MMEEETIEISQTKKSPKFWMRHFWDILFVAILPALCFVFDPLLFHGIEGKPFFAEPLQIATYLSVLILALVFFASFLDISSRSSRLVIMGSLLAGGVLAFSFGVLLLPFTILGLVIVLGILGFIPFFTGARFWRRFNELKLKEVLQPKDLMFVFMGVSIPFLPSLYVYKLGTSVHTQIISDLTDSDQNRIRSAMMQINKTIFCTEFCMLEVIENFGAGKIKLSEDAFASLLLESTGINYKQFLDARAND